MPRSRPSSLQRLRLKGAIAAGGLAAQASRLAHRGAGVSIRGRVIRMLAPDALAELLEGKKTHVVTGTNGKTTTTHLLTAALRTGADRVVTNADGANLQFGIVSAVSTDSRAPIACLETDERAVSDVLRCGEAQTFTILNLSRDQLDRNHEITSLARDWRDTLTELGERGPIVIATVDDPLVVWAASAGREVVWVDAGSTWTQDATLCPACGEVLQRDETWHCPGCGLTEPEPDIVVEGSRILRGEDVLETHLQVPGQFNVGNAACALAAGATIGLDPATALTAMEQVQSPAGRFSTATFGQAEARLMLAKNPAGWATCLPLVQAPTVVLAIDSQYADGQDVSWLWDVDFESLAQRGARVIATGYRGRDLDVRLTYAGVDHELIGSVSDALTGLSGEVDVVATYTPFQLLLDKAGLK